MDWYYAKGDTRFGPVDQAELSRLAQTGALVPTDLVWNATMGDKWALASTVPGLFAAPSSPPPLTPPAQAAVPAERGRTHNRDLMRKARESLVNHWGIAIGFVVLYLVIGCALGSVPCVGLLAPIVIAGPLTLGFVMFFLSLARGAEPEIYQLFAGFKNFATALCAHLLKMLFVFLWALLLIIPGIIAAIAYSMAFYVIADNPAIGSLDAITKSKEMMRGYKWKFFCLNLRFLGWALLCILTCGVGFLWLIPYVQTAHAHFYEDVRPRQA